MAGGHVIEGSNPSNPINMKLKSNWDVTNKVLKDMDMAILVADARTIEETLNAEIIAKIKEKPILYVANKCDLLSEEDFEIEKNKRKNFVFTSAHKHYGVTILKNKITSFAKINKLRLPVAVGILGYPNTGKSSLINALKGKKSASTSSISGHTKALQKIRISSSAYILDTPGVIGGIETEAQLLNKNSIDVSKIKDSVHAAYKLFEANSERISKHYKLDLNLEDFLEKIALKFNMLIKGGEFDEQRAADKLLQDWQTGKIL